MVPSFFITAFLFCVIFIILQRPTESTTALHTIMHLEDGRKNRILLLTAHPDDECMFFAPTISAIVTEINQASKPIIHHFYNSKVPWKGIADLYSLCLSVGDADKLGPIRKGELSRSLGVLGVESSNRWVIDHRDLKDNITLHWSPQIIADVLNQYVIKHQISTILTFDGDGVSGHPNHQSLPNGVKHFLTHYNQTSAIPPPKLFTLATVPVITKYTGMLAPLLAKFNLCRLYLLYISKAQLIQLVYRLGFTSTFTSSNAGPGVQGAQEAIPVFISGISGYSTAINAMREHKSQLVWFRYLYITFSRYMWVNEWIEVKV